MISEIWEQLKSLISGPDTEFEAFLKKHYYDLHNKAKVTAKPVNLGVGNLWQLSVDHPAQKSLPCIHHAPTENIGELRLLLIC